ncbi:hypothetical protein C8A03DRAFT_29321 [Achaetomium macrosporum]|uniref:Uncharacterized protein n=1 Tax=Achaetomium macrosporum TaxID=79813 RepID=A0AAN7CHX5_9PEZI|nr:hypothetical protein C8A03DRAFT_29321 [Achaetomium macrosporum]
MAFRRLAPLVTNYSASVFAEPRSTQPAIEVLDAFCYGTVSHTHPGQDDNNRGGDMATRRALSPERPVQAVGGSGWDAGGVLVSYMAMTGVVDDGDGT